jgi:hypothetical protein
VRKIKRFQQWHGEKFRRHRGEVVARQVYVCDVEAVCGTLVQETREENRERDVSPQEVVSPSDLDGWSGVLNAQDGLLTIVHHRVLKRHLMKLLQLQVLEPRHLM